jgi:DNA polymerase-3 subunit delta'
MFNPHLHGHMPQRERLLRRLQEGKLRGSLLFTGPDGIGKRRVALELAQRELCFRRTACGACEGCQVLQADPLPLVLPNLLRIAPEGKAGVIKVGQIREDDLVEGGVIAWASMAPAPGCQRWILIEDAHRLNGASANMLLKTIEEPPPGTRFILVTHRPEAVLQTIRSRTERIPFAPLSADEAWAVAVEHGWTKDRREAWLALSAGSLRLLEEDAFLRAEAQLEAWLGILEGRGFGEDAEALLPEKDHPLGQAEQLRQPLDLLLRILDDLGRLRAGRAPELAPWTARLAPLASGSLDLKAPQDLLFDAQRNLARNLSPEPLLREVALALR